MSARSDVLLAGAPHGYGSFAFFVSKTSHFVFNGKSLISSPVHYSMQIIHSRACRCAVPVMLLLGLFKDGCPLRGIKRWSDGQVP